MTRTLVFHHGAIGDGVIVWPLLRAMTGQGGVTLIAPPSRSKLAAHCIEGVEPLDGDAPDWSRLFAPAAIDEVSDAVRDRLASADRIVSFISTGRDAWAANLAAIAPAAHRVFVEQRPPEGFRRPVLAWCAEQLHRQGVSVEPMLAPLRRNPDGPVVIHPGSGGRDKCWPAERFDAVIDHLAAIGRPCVVLIGEVERERLDACWVAKWRAITDVTEPADAIELARVIRRAAVYVGNDSGPTHLAAALGVPTIALFGPTDPRVWSPTPGSQAHAVTVLAPPTPSPMTWLAVAPVTAAIARW